MQTLPYQLLPHFKSAYPKKTSKMVKFTTTLLGLAALTAAAPAPQASSLEARDDVFSFQDWIDEIVASPEAEHMSAEDAYKAAQKSHHKRSEASTHPDVLFKRDVSCNEKEVASVSNFPRSAQLRQEPPRAFLTSGRLRMLSSASTSSPHGDPSPATSLTAARPTCARTASRRSLELPTR